MVIQNNQINKKLNLKKKLNQAAFIRPIIVLV